MALASLPRERTGPQHTRPVSGANTNMKLPHRLRLLILSASSVSFLGGVVLAQFQVDTLSPVVGGVSAGGGVVAIDGDTAIVGSYGATANGYQSGAAFAFRLVGGAWTQEGVLLPADQQPSQNFGWAVALSGNRAFVSAQKGGQSPSSGAVYVFRRTGSFPFATWDQVAKLTSPDPTPSQFFGMSIAADGNTLLVGCDQQGAQGWASYFFEVQSGQWQLSQRLPLPSRFGAAVCIDGDKAAISNVLTAPPYGEVRTFGRGPTGWQFEASLAPSAQENDESFGACMDLKDGLLVIGQPTYRAGTGYQQGRVLLSRSQGAAWTNVVPVEWVTEFFEGHAGTSVATNGTEVVALAPTVLQGSVSRGVLAVARWGAGDPLPIKLGSVFPPSWSYPSGWISGVAIDDGTVLVGTSGPVAVVSLVPPAPVTYCTGKLNSAGCVGTVSSVGSASATSSAPFGINATSIVSGKYGLLFFGINGRTAFPFQGGYLCALPPTRRTPAQSSGGNAGANDCSGSYSYDFNALIRSGAHPDLDPGVLVNAQYWYRDPASQSTTGLTNAIEFGVGF